MEYDQFVMDELRRVYGSQLEDFLREIKTPPPRFYLRVNTRLSDPEKLARELGAELDDELEEAIYFQVKCSGSLPLRRDIVIVDGPTAESVMQGAHVYSAGVIEVRAKSRYVSVVGPGGVVVGEGELRGPPGPVVEVKKSLCDVPSLRETRWFSDGLIYVQGKPSQFVAHVLDPRPGELIVDATAAPGGKLTHILQLEPHARVIGIDRTQSKLNKVMEALARLRLEATLLRYDSRYLWETGLRGVDKLLVDPPCSALGLRPKLYDKKDGVQLLRLHNYQRQFIEAAYRVLRPGGELVYSTCTVTMLENEEVIDDPRFEIEYLLRFHPQTHGTGGSS
ncbi:SAM-dependent methyltransferase [Sulfodiicoccus acidiphilus]|uniref:tRNA (cytosine(72)-C(5))-methyltransferase n=1 Tax=Sulfodiicoccus acidiphilus TaxID=1670455 RepID=A0A348B2X7_9CREN|nr:RsmB/NOP family class I SAM-dependent RNA methyltransferase [Sulfodiicoccus acidiphilus]BBD72529.1 SAM-dependent methyltransferase [Sulfodiicoccus acidiphilus]